MMTFSDISDSKKSICCIVCRAHCILIAFCMLIMAKAVIILYVRGWVFCVFCVYRRIYAIYIFVNCL